MCGILVLCLVSLCTVVYSLHPTCEQLWQSYYHFNSNGDVHSFAYPSEDLHIQCIPSGQLHFSQKTISSHTTSGKSLDDWIEKFKQRHHFAKHNLPDVVQWAHGDLVTLDNRRVYSAVKAGLQFIPSVIHQHSDLLPEAQKYRFRIDLNGSHFNGTKFASTYGEAAIYRCLGTSKDFPVFGTLSLPTVEHSITPSMEE